MSKIKNPCFLYERTHLETREKELFITKKTLRQIKEMKKHSVYRYELLSRFMVIQDLNRYVERFYPNATVVSEIKKVTEGVTEETREKMRQKKLGDKNPSAGGLTEEHKQKISSSCKGTRRGSDNHFYGEKHSRETKMKMSLAHRGPRKKRWCVDAEGNEHMVDEDFELPQFWIWGRKRTAISKRT